MVKKKTFKGVTLFAAKALKELFESRHAAEDLAHRVEFDEHKLEERNKKKPSLSPLTNKPFNDVVSRFLGVSLLCQAVDIYNSYCQDVLQLAILNNTTAIPSALTAANRFKDEIKKATKRNTDPAQALFDMFRTGYIADRYVREAIHTHLDIKQHAETELLCLCRNILVHKRGIDSKGEIPAKLLEIGTKRTWLGAPSFPSGHLPLAVNGNQELIVNHSIGLWANESLSVQIHFMDQSLSHFYHLPLHPFPKLTIGRIFVTDNV
jgi:hypothetical protein